MEKLAGGWKSQAGRQVNDLPGGTESEVVYGSAEETLHRLGKMPERHCIGQGGCARVSVCSRQPVGQGGYMTVQKDAEEAMCSGKLCMGAGGVKGCEGGERFKEGV